MTRESTTGALVRGRGCEGRDIGGAFGTEVAGCEDCGSGEAAICNGRFCTRDGWGDLRTRASGAATKAIFLVVLVGSGGVCRTVWVEVEVGNGDGDGLKL